MCRSPCQTRCKTDCAKLITRRMEFVQSQTTPFLCFHNVLVALAFVVVLRGCYELLLGCCQHGCLLAQIQRAPFQCRHLNKHNATNFQWQAICWTKLNVKLLLKLIQCLSGAEFDGMFKSCQKYCIYELNAHERSKNFEWKNTSTPFIKSQFQQ